MSLKERLQASKAKSTKIEYTDLIINSVDVPDLTQAISRLSKANAQTVIDAFGKQAELINQLQAALQKQADQITRIADRPIAPKPKSLTVTYDDGRTATIKPEY